MKWRVSDGNPGREYVWCEGFVNDGLSLWLFSNFYVDEIEYPNLVTYGVGLLGPLTDDLLVCPRNWILA